MSNYLSGDPVTIQITCAAPMSALTLGQWLRNGVPANSDIMLVVGSLPSSDVTVSFTIPPGYADEDEVSLTLDRTTASGTVRICVWSAKLGANVNLARVNGFDVQAQGPLLAVNVKNIDGDTVTKSDGMLSVNIAKWAGVDAALNVAGTLPNVSAGEVMDKTGFGLTAAYDAAKTAAPAGAKMDIIDAPNATALAAVATQVDTTLTTSHGAGSWTTGAGGGGDGIPVGGSVALTFKDADGFAVPSVVFGIVGQGSGQAGPNGTFACGLPAGTYTVVASPRNGVLFADTEITVPANGGSFDISGTAVSIPLPDDPTNCTVTFVATHAGAAYAGATFNFQCSSPQSGSGNGYIQDKRPIVSASDGTVSIALPQGSTWTCTPPTGRPFTIRVPSRSIYQLPNFAV